MRNKRRIPIILDLFLNKETLLDFLVSSDQKIIDEIYNNWEMITKTWNEYPDLRFGQLLVNLRLIPSIKIETYIWNIEEDDWLIKNNYINIEDIKFWGVNYYKNNKPRKTTKYKLLKDLDLDHIKNIIIFFEKNGNINRLNPKYLKYFNKRIKLNE